MDELRMNCLSFGDNVVCSSTIEMNCTLLLATGIITSHGRTFTTWSKSLRNVWRVTGCFWSTCAYWINIRLWSLCSCLCFLMDIFVLFPEVIIGNHRMPRTFVFTSSSAVRIPAHYFSCQLYYVMIGFSSEASTNLAWIRSSEWD